MFDRYKYIDAAEDEGDGGNTQNNKPIMEYNLYRANLDSAGNGDTYITTVNAIDPDGETLTYSLVDAPSYFYIDSSTGEIYTTATMLTLFNAHGSEVTLTVYAEDTFIEGATEVNATTSEADVTITLG